MPQTPQQEIERLTALMGSDQDPGGRAFATLADACLRAGEVERAMELVSQGTGRHPDFASGWVVAARVHAGAGRDDEARAALERVVELDGENVPTVLELARMAEHSDDRGLALELYRRAEHLDHTDPQVRAKIEVLESLPEEAEPEPEPMPPVEPATPAADEIVAIDSLAPDPPDPEPMVAAEPAIETPVPQTPAVDDVISIDSLAPDPEPELAAEPEALFEPEVSLEPEPDPEPDPMTVIDPQVFEPEEEPVAAAPPELEDEPVEPAMGGEMLTRTMAEVLAKQGLTDAAIGVYEKLIAREPDDASLQARLAELKGGPAVAAPPPAVSDEVVSIDSLAPDR